MSSHGISYNARVVWIARPPSTPARGYLRTMENRWAKSPGSGKTLFVAAARSAPARYVLIARRRAGTGRYAASRRHAGEVAIDA